MRPGKYRNFVLSSHVCVRSYVYICVVSMMRITELLVKGHPALILVARVGHEAAATTTWTLGVAAADAPRALPTDADYQ